MTEKMLTNEEGRLLVRLARDTINAALQGKPGRTVQELTEPVFMQQYGVFVTLTKHHQLRGCIGNLIASESLKEGVKRNALNAAFHDGRFAPVSLDELNDISVEVSVLTEPESLVYEDSSDLLQRLRPAIDGVILSKGMYRATFLPQVWEQLPKVEDFLSHLCRKAGIAADSWCYEHPDIAIYQVQKFTEEEKE